MLEKIGDVKNRFIERGWAGFASLPVTAGLVETQSCHIQAGGNDALEMISPNLAELASYVLR